MQNHLNILIVQQLSWGIKIGHKIAKILQKDGHQLSAFVHGQQTEKYLRKQTDIQYQYMYFADPLYDEGDDIVTTQQVQEIEERYNLDSIWRTIYSDRFLVYTFLNSRHVKAQKPVSNDYILSVCWNTYRTVQDLLDKSMPDYVIAPVIGCLANYLLHLECKQRNIPFSIIGTARIGKNRFFADNHYHYSSLVKDRHETLMFHPEESPKYEEAKQIYSQMRSANSSVKSEYLKQVRQKTLGPSNKWVQICLGLILFPARIVKALLMHKRIFGFHRIWNPANSRLNAVLNVYIGLREKFLATDNQGKCIPSVDEINFRYVFFPLHYEPELSLMVYCPEYSNQTELCRRVALLLPKGVRLLVKEHPNMVPSRKKQFYENLNGLPNLEIIYGSVPSEKIFTNKQCVAVLTISSTTGLEAAMNGKPVVVLTPEFEKLPTVYYTATLSNAIKRLQILCSENIKFDAEKVNKGNLAYLCALLEHSFDTDYAKYWVTGGGDFDAEKTVQAIYRWLEEKSDYQPTT